MRPRLLVLFLMPSLHGLHCLHRLSFCVLPLFSPLTMPAGPSVVAGRRNPLQLAKQRAQTCPLGPPSTPRARSSHANGAPRRLRRQLTLLARPGSCLPTTQLQRGQLQAAPAHSLSCTKMPSGGQSALLRLQPHRPRRPGRAAPSSQTSAPMRCARSATPAPAPSLRACTGRRSWRARGSRPRARASLRRSALQRTPRSTPPIAAAASLPLKRRLPALLPDYLVEHPKAQAAATS